jgi:xylulokinase
LQKPGFKQGEWVGFGLSGQMHGTVCVDDRGNVLRSAIIWADQRSARQVTNVYEKIGSERLGEWTANPLATGFMLASWLWLAENEPLILGKTHRLFLPKDYLRYRLTGETGTEPSDASSTLVFDTVNKTWSIDLLDALDLNPSLLPSVHPSAGVAGTLTEKWPQNAGC